MRIRFVNEIKIELRRVRVHGHVIFRQIWIDDTPDFFICHRRFHQRRAETEKHSAHDLAARQTGIDYSTDVINAGRALHPDLSKQIDLHLDKDRAKRMEGKPFSLLPVRLGIELGLNFLLTGAGEKIR